MVAAPAAATRACAPPSRGALPHARMRAAQERYAARPARSVFRPLGPISRGVADVEAALALLSRGGGQQLVLSGPGIGTRDGRTWYLAASPGTVGLVTVDQTRRDRALERASHVQRVTADALATYADPTTGQLDVRFLDRRVRGSIVEWSRKSRARMTRRIAQLDYAAWDAAVAGREGWTWGMVTLTYPGDWAPLVPTGEAGKRQLRAFRDAVRHEWGPAAAWALWKLEFQRRGAPHFHLLMRIPPLTSRGEGYEAWLSRTWARIVRRDAARHGHLMGPAEHARHLAAGTGVDYSRRMTDPRRIGVYFAKHSAKALDDKEYQHVVPGLWLDSGGAGRFWGVWGVPYATRYLEVEPDEAVAVRRALRRVLRARTARRVWTLGSSGAMTGGTVVVNDGPALVSQLARYLAICRRPVYDGPDVLPERPVLP